MSEKMLMESSVDNRETLAGNSGINMNNQASLIQQFINYLRAERHFSPHTSKCYTADLQQFCQYLCGTTAQITAGKTGPDDNGHALQQAKQLG